MFAAAYYAGAYYLGEYRGGQHTWHNFAASGAAAGVGAALWLLRPLRALRPLAFAAGLGAALGGGGAFLVSLTGQPYWEEGHDFEGYFLGQKVNLKKKGDGAEGVAAGAGQG